MAYELRDFDDIIDMVMEEMKHQSTDTVSLNRIKRDINAVYLDEVVPFKRWNWLAGHTEVQHKAYYNAGTCTVTPESTTVTLSVAPATATGSRKNYLFSVDGFDEIYRISAHTAGSTTVTLASQYNGSASSTATFKIWADTIALPTNCKETVEVWQDFYRSPLEPKGLQEFRRIVREAPKSALKPLYYHTYDYYDPSESAEVESTRYRQLKIHPSLVSDTITLHVDYVKEATALDLDADEPLMPYEDRIVLVYGALARAWARERNPEESLRNERLFKEKLDRMAGKVEDGFDKPQIVPDNLYVRKKRGPRSGARFRQIGVASGSNSYTSPTYITNAEIGSGNTLSANLTVNSGVTIDGVDISVLNTEVDTLQALTSGYIFVGNSSNVTTAVAMSGDITISNTGVTAIGTGVIVNTDIDASAAIARTKLASGTAYRILANTSAGVMSENAALTAAHVIYADANGQLAGEAALAKSRGGAGADMSSVTFPSSGVIQTKVSSTTDNALVRFDGTTGTQQNSTVTLGDTGAIVNTLGADVVGYKSVLFAGAVSDQMQFFLDDGSTNVFKVGAGGIIQGRISFKTNAGVGFDDNRFYVDSNYSTVNFNNGAANPAWNLTGSNGTQDFLTQLQVTASKAGNICLINKAAAAQTANISESRDSSGNVLNYVAANGRIQADTGFGAKRRTTATSDTALITDYFLGVTDNSSARTITLPAANTMKAGQMLVIKDEAGTAGSANNITIARAGSDTIDGATSVTITADYGVIRLYSNGSDKYFSF